MRAKRLLLILGVAASALLRPAQSAPFESWQAEDLNLGGTSRDAMIFAKGKFWVRYAQGNGGIWVSEDGLDWTQTPNGPLFYGGLAFGNERFIAPYMHGHAVSSDGLAWNYSLSSEPTLWNDFGSTVAFGNGVFVMARGIWLRPQSLHRTVDGESWISAHTLENSSNYVHSVSFANGRFLASGGRTHSLEDNFLLVSANGMDWTNLPAAAGETMPRFGRIAYGDGKYVGVSTELVTFSLDGEFKTLSRWSPGEGLMSDVAYADGKFVAVGDHAAYSHDGIAWQPSALPKIGTLWKLAHGNGRFVAIGAHASVVSTNGTDWVTEGAALAEVTGLVHADGKFVAVGTKRFDAGSAVIISTERGKWRARDVLPGTNRVTELGYAGGTFLAAAGAKAYTSPDALTWRQIETGFDGEIVALAHFQGRFWGAGTNAAGDGVIVEAVSGANWRIAKTVAGMPIVGIAASSERLVAIAGTNFFQGFIYSSANGTDWTENKELIFRPYSIAWLGGRFVIGGHFAGRAVSSGGVTWTQQADGQESLGILMHTGAAYLAIHAIGSTEISNGTRLLASPDGQAWERRVITTVKPPHVPATMFRLSAGAIGSRRVVVAGGNVLYETEPLAPSVRSIAREGAGLRLSFGENWTGEPATIEASEDLRNWSVVPNMSEAQPVLGDVSAAKRFYRVKAN